VFTTGADNRFQRLFVSFYASIHGFVNGCFPIVALGGIQLKSKYLSTVLSATSFDADGGLFPLAFAVVDVENDESWTWFMSELHKALEVNIECMPQIIFLSDGQKGIVDAIRRKFPKSSHAFCMRHLSESISKEFKNSRLIHFLWKAAYATTTTTAFKEKMAEIEEASPEAAKWALVYFEGTRYGHLSSNIEVFNKWILDARELPIIHVIERIHGNLITEFDDRRLRSSSWCFVLAPSAERQMAEAINHASTYQVLRSDEVEFEVISADRSDIVNIGSRSCSCRDWQLYGIPCLSHVVRTSMHILQSVLLLQVTGKPMQRSYTPSLENLNGEQMNLLWIMILQLCGPRNFADLQGDRKRNEFVRRTIIATNIQCIVVAVIKLDITRQHAKQR
jgi:hypothetical protein